MMSSIGRIFFHGCVICIFAPAFFCAILYTIAPPSLQGDRPVETTVVRQFLKGVAVGFLLSPFTFHWTIPLSVVAGIACAAAQSKDRLGWLTCGALGAIAGIFMGLFAVYHYSLPITYGTGMLLGAIVGTTSGLALKAVWSTPYRSEQVCQHLLTEAGERSDNENPYRV